MYWFNTRVLTQLIVSGKAEKWRYCLFHGSPNQRPGGICPAFHFLTDVGKFLLISKSQNYIVFVSTRFGPDPLQCLDNVTWCMTPFIIITIIAISRPRSAQHKYVFFFYLNLASRTEPHVHLLRKVHFYCSGRELWCWTWLIMITMKMAIMIIMMVNMFFKSFPLGTNGKVRLLRR